MAGPGLDGTGWDAVTRRELEQVRSDLRGDLRDLRGAVDRLDLHGTRGSGVMEQKLYDLADDVSTLKAEAKQAQRDRQANRRWLIGIGFTAGGVIAAVLALLVQIVSTTR